MGRHLPPSPSYFSVYRASPSSSQGIAGRGEAVPHRTVEEQRDGAPGEAVILLKSFRAFYKSQKACWWHSSCLKTYGLTLLFTVLKLIPRSQMNPFHFPLPVKPYWPFLFHWPCLIATPNQLYQKALCFDQSPLSLCCSKGFWASKIICSVLLGSFELALPCQNHCLLEYIQAVKQKGGHWLMKPNLSIPCRLPRCVPRPFSLLSLPFLWRKLWFMFFLTSSVAGM